MNRIISWGEVRLGLRLIAKQPILSLTIILALATGICFATMGYTLRDELMNAELPYAGGDRFVRINGLHRGGGAPLMLDRYHALKERASSLEHVGAIGGRPYTLSYASGEIESVRGASMTPSSMRWVEASPLAGRTLIPADGEPGAEPVALIRESLWRRRFSADPATVGQLVVVGGQPRTVVGIMPDTFEFPSSGELWLPRNEQTLGVQDGDASLLDVGVFAVMRTGATVEDTSTEVAQIAGQFKETEPVTEGERFRVFRFTGDSDNAALAVNMLVGVLVLLLLVVASNVATLIFARTWSRAQELAVRTALGAARSRVVGQLFFETLVLGSIAAVLGIAGAYSAFRYIKGSFEGWPFWVSFDLNPRVVAFVVLMTLLVSAVSGLWPALRVTRHDLRNSLQAGRGFAFGGFGKAGAFMLVLEIALSVTLLNGAVTMARAFTSYIDEIPALPKNQILTAQLGRIREPKDRDRLVAAARALPGVVAAGAGAQLPRLYPPPRPVSVEAIGDEPIIAPQPAPGHAVGEGFLEAIGARALTGRLLTSADYLDGAAPVVIVNEPFVQKFLGGRYPIGRRIKIEDRESSEPPPFREIVGVVPDLGLSPGDPALTAGFYTPVRDERLWFIAVRTTADPLTLIAPLRAAVANVNPDLQLEEVRTLEQAGYEERVFLSGVAFALTAMGGIALVLSIVGIYALLSFMVTRRTREIGIRVALGAARWQVLRSITGGALVYLVIGGVIGSLLGVTFVQLRSFILISIPAPGFWMPATIFLTLAIAGLTACWIPARRALGIRPSEALSAD